MFKALQIHLPRISWGITILGALVLASLSVLYTVLNQDEGWYLYAAVLVSEGQMPYKDFCYTQTPLLPLMYSVCVKMITEQGILGGRLLTLLFGAGATVCGMLLARELCREESKAKADRAALLVLILVGSCIFQLSFFSTVKTYAGAALFIMAGCLALARAQRGQKWGWLLCAALLFSCAAGVRLSAVLFLPLCCFYLLFCRDYFAPKGWLIFGASGVVFCGLIFIPFYLLAPENFMFGVVDYHQAREVGGWASLIKLKGMFVLHLIRHYTIWLVILAGMLIVYGIRGLFSDREFDKPSFLTSFIRFLWVTLSAVTLLHFTAAVPYPEYQVMVMPVLAVIVSVLFTRWVSEKYQVMAVFVIMCAGFLHSASSPILQSWAIRGMDRIWPISRDITTVNEVRHAARVIKEHADDNDLLLTQDLYLAVEAGMKVPKGWEMGPFSYMPELDTPTAQRLHVLNQELLEKSIMESEYAVAAISGYSFAIASPAVTPVDIKQRRHFISLIESRCTRIHQNTLFGQNNAGLEIYIPTEE